MVKFLDFQSHDLPFTGQSFPGRQRTQLIGTLDYSFKSKKNTGKMVPIHQCLERGLNTGTMVTVPPSPHSEATQFNLSLYISGTSHALVPLPEPRASA